MIPPAVVRWGAVLFALPIALSACTSPSPGENVTTSRPSTASANFAQADARIRAALVEVARRLTDEVGAELSSTVPEPSRSSCGDGGVRGYYRLPDFTTPIADEKWPTAVQVVEEVFNPLGATEVTVHLDKPGKHTLSLTAPDGLEVDFGTIVVADLTVTGPCVAE